MVDVTAAVLIKDKKLFIAQRPSTDLLAGKWELPGGKVEAGESPETCLKREMHEEFGINVAVQDCIAENVHHYEHISIRLMAYAVTWENGDLHPQEHDNIDWVDNQELDAVDFAPADIPLIQAIREKQLLM